MPFSESVNSEARVVVLLSSRLVCRRGLSTFIICLGNNDEVLSVSFAVVCFFIVLLVVSSWSFSKANCIVTGRSETGVTISDVVDALYTYHSPSSLLLEPMT